MTQFFALLKMEYKNKKKVLPIKNKAMGMFLTGAGFLIKNALAVFLLVMLSRYLVSYSVVNALEFDFLIIAVVIAQVLQFFVGLNQIVKAQQNSKEIKEVLMIPASNQVLYLSKIAYFYIRHLIAYVLLLLPVFLTWSIQTAQGPVFYLMLLPVMLMLPAIPIMLSSLFAFAMIRVSSFLKANFYLNLIVFSLIIAFGFYYYIQLIKIVVELFQNQSIGSLLSLGDIASLQKITSKFFIAVLFKNILVGSVAVRSFVVLFSVSLMIFMLVYYLAKRNYRSVMWRLADSEINYGLKNTKIRFLPQTINLLSKEFKLVFRNYNYSFSFFTIALTTPLIVFFSSRALSEFSFAKTNISINPPLTLFLLLIFITLTTSFSATTITRESRSFLISKTIPIKATKQIAVKILFYISVLFIAILASVSALFFAGLISFIDFGLILLAVVIVVYGGVCSNINMDIKNPKLKDIKGANNALTNINVSKSMTGGLLLAVFLGTVAITLSFMFGGLLWYAPVFVFGICYTVYKHIKLFKNLEKKHHEIEI